VLSRRGRRFGCIDCCLWHRGSVGVELNSSSVSAEQTEVPTHAGLGFPTPSLFRLLTPSGDWGFRNSTRGTDARSSFLARTQSPGLKTGGLVHDCRSASESKDGVSILSGSTESDRSILWAVPSLTPDRSLLALSLLVKQLFNKFIRETLASASPFLSLSPNETPPRAPRQVLSRHQR